MHGQDLWVFRESGVGDIDLTGFKVVARDGAIGKIHEATYEAGSGYVVVNTGPWIFGRHVLLPAGTLDRVDPAAERVFVNRTKAEIKRSPDFDPVRGVDHDYRRQIGTYYGADEPVVHGGLTPTGTEPPPPDR
jgi:hypothetical protein